MIDIFMSANLYPAQFIICAIAAFIPVFIWMFLFINKAEKDIFHVVLTFIFGMGSAGIILLYQSFWGDGPLNLIFFGVEAYDFKKNITTLVSGALLVPFCIYMGVGFLEEVLKHFVVVQADKRIFSSIDEVIELSIVAALGFAFLENIAYFYREFLQGGLSSGFWILAIQRSIFVVFVHILCSAIYGYFYGMSFFAKPYMQYQMQQGKRFFIASILHKIFKFKRANIFRERMVITGLVVASVLHGLYDFAMHVNPVFYIGDTVLQLHVVLLPCMLVFGFMYLSHLLNRKVNMEEFGEMEIEYVYKRPHESIGRNSRSERFSEGIQEQNTPVSWA